MKRALLCALFCVSCASSPEAGGGSSSSTSSPSSDSAPADDCTLARTAAESAWARQFARVQELTPEDRADMAKQHSVATAAELQRLEQEAAEGGDDIMLDAVEKTKAANVACGQR